MRLRPALAVSGGVMGVFEVVLVSSSFREPRSRIDRGGFAKSLSYAMLGIVKSNRLLRSLHNQPHQKHECLAGDGSFLHDVVIRACARETGRQTGGESEKFSRPFPMHCIMCRPTMQLMKPLLLHWNYCSPHHCARRSHWRDPWPCRNIGKGASTDIMSVAGAGTETPSLKLSYSSCYDSKHMESGTSCLR